MIITKIDPKLGRYFGSAKLIIPRLGRQFWNQTFENEADCDVEEIR
jgi:hypothetical protein